MVVLKSFLFISNIFFTGTIDIKLTKANHQRLVDCAIQIANENFNFRRITVILTRDVEDTLTTKFLGSYKGTVMIDTKGNNLNTRQVVLLIESYNSFNKILGKLKPDLKGDTLLNSDTKYLIVILKHPHRLRHLNSVLWRYFVVNAIIIVEDESGQICLYTYYPYKNHLNCSNTEPKLIDYWKENGTLSKDLYADKMKRMNGCPFYVSTNKLYHPLTEKRILLQIVKRAMVRLLREVMDFTAIISTRDYVSIDSDRAKNWSDSLNDVLSGVANISTSSIPLGIDRSGLLSYTMPYFRVRLAWLAPPMQSRPPWYRLLSPLNGYLWVLILLVTVFVKLLPYFLQMKPINKFTFKYFKTLKNVNAVALRAWGMLCGQPIKLIPRRFRDIYIISLWLWFTFVIRNAYQSVLIGALKTDTFTGTYTNFQEIIDDGIEFGGRAGILSYFEHDTLIRENFKIITEVRFEDTFRDILEGKKKFVMATSLEYALAFCVTHGLQEVECGRILTDSVLTVPLVVWMKSQSPFRRPLSLWIPRFIESGLLENKVSKSSYTISKNSDPSPLSLLQTAGCFLCLVMGYGISTLVFIIELLKNNPIRRHPIVYTGCPRNNRLS